MRYSDAELNLVKRTFAGNDERLFALRKLFLQMPLDVIDQSLLSVFRANEPLMQLMRKTYLPQLSADVPINQEIDLWMTVDLKDKSPVAAWPFICSREDVITYLEEQLDRLEYGDSDIVGTTTIDLASLTTIDEKNPEATYINLITRNTLISHCEMQLFQFQVLAGQADETVEETKARLAKNSNQ